MNPNWSCFNKWEFSNGNKWSPLKAHGLRKAWKYTVQGELRNLIPGGDEDCIIAFSGKESVVRLDLSGQVVWKTSLFEGLPAKNEYVLPSIVIGGAWFYRETLFAEVAGVAPIQLSPETGEVLRRMKYMTGQEPFDRNRNYSTSLFLINGEWRTPSSPNSLCKIARSGFLELLDSIALPPCLGWQGGQTGQSLVPPFNPSGKVDLVVDVAMLCGNWVVFECFTRGRNRHLRVAKEGDYFSAFVVKDGVDAFIAVEERYLVTKHHDENRSQWWLECRLLNDPEQVLWRTEACGWMTWFMGTGDTVWHTEWSGPDVKGKDWLIGRDLATGAEIYRKPEACRLMGLFCGPLIITASARSITASEPAP